MLTLKQLNAEAKRRGVVFKNDENWGEVSFKLYKSIAAEDNKKAYEKFKKEWIANWESDQKTYEKDWYSFQKANPKAKWAQGPYKKHTYTEAIIQDEFEFEQDDGLEEGICFEESDSTFSCAIREFGRFDMHPDYNKHWELLLQWYVRKSDHTYFKCAVPDTKEWKALNAALAAIGFEQRASETSNHGKYKVFVWEYIKK